MPEECLQSIGKPSLRREAREKVTGQARYVFDMEMPGMLYAKVLHSPYARAEIVSIELAEAKALPGVKAILTGEDLPYLLGLYMIFSARGRSLSSSSRGDQGRGKNSY